MLRETARPIPWPPWIPDDEHAPFPNGPAVPPDVDADTWGKLKEVLLETLPLQEDQVRYDVQLKALEMDSLDAVMFVTDVEKTFGIEVPDDVADDVFRWGSTKTLGNVYELACQLIDEQLK
jgi:acyl carrier protein